MDIVVTLAAVLLSCSQAAFTVSVGVVDLNVTALKGQDAKLPCSIDSLQENVSVVWMDKNENVLYYNENRIIDDLRFTMSKLGRNWDLYIRQVDSQDEGGYRCVANTVPIKLKYYHLTVFVPAEIDVDTSSPDVEAPQGTTVSLYCNATGYPTPNVTWVKRKADEPSNSTNIVKLRQSSPALTLWNVTRYLDEIYTCSASNGYGNPDEHSIRVTVKFQPEIRTMQRKVLQYKGRDVQFSCNIAGYETPKMYFAKDNFEIEDSPVRHKKHKYSWKKLQDSVDYKIQMNLTVYDIQDEDYGYYRCVAVNSQGREERYIELKAPRRQTTLRPTSRPQTKAKLLIQTKATKPTTSTVAMITRKATVQVQELPPELDKKGKNSATIAKQSKENRANENSLTYTLLFFISSVYYLLLY